MVLVLLGCGEGATKRTTSPPDVDVKGARGSIDADDEAAANDLRALMFAREYGAGMHKGEVLLRHFVRGRAGAWAVCALALGGRSMDAKRAIERFDASDPWAPFASACLLHAEMSNPEALERSAAALERSKGHDDAVWLRALVLGHRGELEAILALREQPIDDLRIAGEVDLLVGQALALRAWINRGGDELDRALAMAEAVRRTQPESINAWIRPAEWLSHVARYQEALVLAEAAIERAPQSEAARFLLWDVLLGASHVDAQARMTRIAADLERMVAAAPNDAEVLFRAAEYYGRLDLVEERERLWARIAAEFPDSRAEEAIAWERVRELGQEVDKQRRQQDRVDPALELRMVEMYRALIERPQHHHPHWLGGAYIHLFFHHSSQEDVDAEHLRELVEGMVAHDELNPQITHGEAARSLSKYPAHREWALQLVEEGIERVRRRLVHERGELERTGSYEMTRAWSLGEMYLAKADVLHALGRVEEAGQVLELAVKTNGDDERIFVKLGELARERGDYDAAELAFIRGFATRARSDVRPVRAAIEAMYVERHGSKRGLERYLRRLEREDTARRKAAVLAAELEQPRRLPDFDLMQVTQGRRRSAGLEGKIALVHFWSMYCGPCIHQMKEIEQLIAKYERDPHVEVVIISNDGSRDDVARWLADNGHAIPMLIDDGYAQRAGIWAWPTTLFVDRGGKVRFESTGSTPYLLEEYGWRLDDLRKE